MTTTQTRQKLTLPGPARAGWRVDVPAIREAIELLGIKRPIEVKITGGVSRRGAHRDRIDHHVITVNTDKSAELASRTLWHELRHCEQAERFATSEEWWAAYALETRRNGGGRLGYLFNRYEVEAREASEMHDALALTRR